MENIGVYVHIPFCKRKCVYCDFYSVADSRLFKQYCNSLKKEIAEYKNKNLMADTIYFGGGTPSVLPADMLKGIFFEIKNNFNIAENLEATIELNPCTCNLKFLQELKKIGFNRVSFGVQSAVDSELESLGRLHNFEQATMAVEYAKQAGFKNISCDLMIGIPYSTMKSFEYSLNKICDLDIQHISAYMLKVEPNTPLAKNSKLLSHIADEDLVCDMYERMCEILKSKDFVHYEISNFARQGFESRHNTKYWILEDYIGFGSSAHSFFEGKRFYNPPDINNYLNNNFEKISEPVDVKQEYLMLALRLNKGVEISRLSQIYGEQAGTIIEKAKQLEKHNLISFGKNNFCLTEKGFLLSNQIICQILP